MNDPQPRIEARNVSRRFSGTQALRPTTLIVPQGTTVLIGPSGCGKSTLLRMMIGLIRPDTGEVSVEGIVLSPATVRAARLRIGYVIQEGGLFPHFTARENATLMARHLGWVPARVEDRTRELADLVHLSKEALDRYPVELSGGQRQRVSLMRALMLDPSILLLDEPLGALDPMIRSDLQTDLRVIFRALGKTVVLVTHDLAEAQYLGDRIVLMRDGTIVQQGSLAEIVSKPAEPFVTQFIQAQRRPELS
jgi:osmoprotectant transport system ATP-binding protein